MKHATTAKVERESGQGGRKRAKKYKATNVHSDKLSDFGVGKLNSHEMSAKRSDGNKPNKADQDFEKLVSNKGDVWPAKKANREQSNPKRYSWGKSGPGRKA